MVLVRLLFGLSPRQLSRYGGASVKVSNPEGGEVLYTAVAVSST